MALKAKLTKDEHAKLDDGLKAHYTEKDGAFVLSVDGMIAQDEFDAVESKLAEFRDNNRTLFSKLKAFEGIDPNEHASLKAEIDRLKKAGVQKPDDIAALVAAEIAKATKGFEERVKTIETERDQANQRLAEKSLEDALWEVGSKAIRESARRDFLMRAKEVFKFEDGKVIAKQGDATLYSKRRGRTTEALTIDEFVNDPEWLLKDADHLYKNSTGSGAKKGDTSTDGGRILSNDPSVLGANLEALAQGKVSVQAGA